MAGSSAFPRVATCILSLLVLGGLGESRSSYAAEDTVRLSVADPGTIQDDARRGSLIRELVRQALLITARDELGLSTRDATLRESLGDAQELGPPLEIVTTAFKDDRVTIRVTKSGSDQALWDHELQLAGPGNLYDRLASAAERLSRNELATLLQQQGFEGERHAFHDSLSLPDEIANLLQQMNCLAQYDALRRLHADIAQRGQSPELLAALCRGYANLGSLSECHWSPDHKAFHARALLYAERLAVLTSQSPWAHWHQAYVRAMLGLHRSGTDSLAAADKKLDPESPPRARLAQPAWLPAVKLYCDYDYRGLEAAASAGDAQRLARYFQLLAGEFAVYESTTMRLTERVLETDPDCLRATDLLARNSPLGIARITVAGMPAQLALSVNARLAGMGGLPESVIELVAQHAKAADTEEEYALRAKLIAELKARGAIETDRLEPSLEVLGQLVEEASFLQAWHEVHIYRHSLGTSADRSITALKPLFEHHRYAAYLEGLQGNLVDARVAMNRLAKEIRPVELEIDLERMLLDLSAVHRTVALGFGYNTFGHMDEIYRDLVYGLEHENRLPVSVDWVGLLREASPALPATVAATVKKDWTRAAPQAKEWEAKYGEIPAVMGALAEQYLGLKQYDDAERALRKVIAAAPEFEPYAKLAELYWAKRQPERYKRTFEEYLKQPADGGLGHAMANERLARYYMSQRLWEEARPYADAAAQSGSAWGMLTAGDCYYGLQDFKTSEKYARMLSQRYRDSATHWFFWCQLSGHGDLQAAAALARDYFDAQPRPVPIGLMDQFAFLHLLQGELPQAREVFVSAFERDPDAFRSLHVALIDDALGNVTGRDEWLEKCVEHGRRASNSAIPKYSYSKLAQVMQRSLAEGERAGISVARVEELIKEGEAGVPTNIEYFCGAFLQKHGDPQLAESYLMRAASSPVIKYNRLAARRALRQANVEIGDFRAFETGRGE